MGREAAVPFNIQGFSKFVRSNPKSDRFKVHGFHHVDFWCGDATNTSLRLSHGLGMPLVAKFDLSTGNRVHASYLLRSGNLNFLFTAPYSPSLYSSSTSTSTIPTFDFGTHLFFVTAHGLAVRAVILSVEDARVAFDASLAAEAYPVSKPVQLDGQVTLAEVKLYGDVVLPYISHANTKKSINDDHKPHCCFLPKFVPVKAGDKSDDHENTFGITAVDHVAGIVPELGPAVVYLMGITGFHDFAEFVAQDMLGLTETAIETVFIANNDESIILNLAEPVRSTKQNGYAQTFLDHNQGPGVQHLALLTKDIFKTLREMRKRSTTGRFTFMPPAQPEYYKEMRIWAGDVLTEEQIQECEEFSIRVDKDHDGVLLQIFTTPVGDRPTLRCEIIQRIGCMVEGKDGELYQKGGCGGFGKGNIMRLIKSIEEYERSLLLSDEPA